MRGARIERPIGQADSLVSCSFLPDPDKRHEFGMLPLRGSVVGFAVESEKLSNGGTTHAVEEMDFPSEGSRRESHHPSAWPTSCWQYRTHAHRTSRKVRGRVGHPRWV